MKIVFNKMFLLENPVIFWVFVVLMLVIIITTFYYVGEIVKNDN